MDAKALLGRQMASIADTLAKASQRRDREVKKRSVNSSPSIAPSVPPVPPSVTSGTGSSAPGGVVVFSGRHAKRDRKAFAFGQFDLEQKGANDVMDPTTAPRENPWGDDGDGDDGDGDDAANNGSLNGSDDGDLQEMLTHLKQIDPTIGTHNEQKEDAIHSNGIDPIPDSHETDDSKAALAEPEYTPWTNGVQAEDTSDDFDLKRMLAEFDKNPIRAEDEDDDLEELLRGSRSGSSSTEKVAIDSSEGSSTAVDVIEKTTSTVEDNDPRRMLADIEELSNNDPKRMLAELERMSAPANVSLSGNDGDDLGALRANLSDWLSLSDGQHLPETKHQQEQLSNIHNGTKPVCPKHLVPYVIALELELSGQEWEKGLFWTEYLFGSGLNSHKAEQEKAVVVAQADKDLTELIEYTLQEEEKYQRAEKERRLPRRVVVSNIATGAVEGDLKDFFHGFQNLIQEVKILPGRDPVKGTQKAYLDCYSREAATQVSFMYGHIFGLTLDIQLAIPRGEDEPY